MRERGRQTEGERDVKMGARVFYNLILEITHHYFCHIPLAPLINPCTLWEGDDKWVTFRRWESLGITSEVGHLSWFAGNFLKLTLS